VKTQEVSRDGVILPVTAREKPHEREVIVTCPGILNKHGTRVALEVKANDRVKYSKFGGIEIKLNEEKLPIIPESDILVSKDQRECNQNR
jgi:chaperonin GroES